MKLQRAQYFSGFILNYCHKPHVHSNTIDAFLYTSRPVCFDIPLKNVRGEFIHVFADKI